MPHRIMKIALINNEIDITINSLHYVLKYSSLMDSKRKSEIGRLLVKLEKSAAKLPDIKKIEVEVENA